MRNAEPRKFVDCIMIAGRKTYSRGKFQVPLPKGSWNRNQELVERFYNWNSSELLEAQVVSQFVTAAFKIHSNCEEYN